MKENLLVTGKNINPFPIDPNLIVSTGLPVDGDVGAVIKPISFDSDISRGRNVISLSTVVMPDECGINKSNGDAGNTFNIVDSTLWFNSGYNTVIEQSLLESAITQTSPLSSLCISNLTLSTDMSNVDFVKTQRELPIKDSHIDLTGIPLDKFVLVVGICRNPLAVMSLVGATADQFVIAYNRVNTLSAYFNGYVVFGYKKNLTDQLYFELSSGTYSNLNTFSVFAIS